MGGLDTIGQALIFAQALQYCCLNKNTDDLINKNENMMSLHTVLKQRYIDISLQGVPLTTCVRISFLTAYVRLRLGSCYCHSAFIKCFFTKPTTTSDINDLLSCYLSLSHDASGFTLQKRCIPELPPKRGGWSE